MKKIGLINNQIFSIVILLVVSVLNGCASMIDDMTDHTNYHRPSHVDESFNIHGKLNIQSNTNSLYANYNWSMNNQQEVLSLKNPLGITMARMTIVAGVTTIQLLDGRVFTGDQVDAMTEQSIGVAIPLNYMHNWVQGIPLPQYDYTVTENGFTQLGYNVGYLSWYDANHPKLVKITQNDLVIKIFINWS